jgi:hypothetical protein
MKSVEDRIARAYQDSQQATINLIFAELALGLTFCKITSYEVKKGEKFNADLNLARMALNATEIHVDRKDETSGVRSNDGAGRTTQIRAGRIGTEMAPEVTSRESFPSTAFNERVDRRFCSRV